MNYDTWKTRSPDDELHDAGGYANEDELEEVYDLLDKQRRENELYRKALLGLYGLLVLISNRDDLSDDLRDVIANNHRSVEAANLLQPADRLEWPKF